MNATTIAVSAPPRPTTAVWGLLLALSVLWGGSFLFQGVAVRELPPLTIVAARVGIAALALHAALRLAGIPFPTSRAALLGFLGMGVLNNAVPFALIVWGQQHIASGLAAILNATTPLFTVLVAHALTRDEKATPAKLAGILCGLIGVAVLMGGGGAAADPWAVMACLGGALSYALAGMFGRRFRRLGIPPLATATGQVTAASALLLPLALMVDAPWRLPAPSAATVGSLAGLGLLCTALAYLLYFRILAAAGATTLLLVTFLIPPNAILFGTTLLGEPLLARHLAGMALIGGGLALVAGWFRPR